ncbi:Lrp/AsnC family transcriptional regulator [Leucobacter albus]|uniref:Lrp/AsnC family transcriptional regulator n=1 Tax=Leucobacter albus TaxID=272210 RepID=A0ABW3TSF8_9MICO
MDFDGALIDSLRENGRIPVAELSRRIGIPRQRVQERMQALLASGAIRVVANVHPALLGIHSFCDVLIWVDGPAAPVLASLSELRETTLISAVSGNCDIVVEVSAESRAHLEALLSRIRAIDGVRETASSQLLRIFKSRFESENDLSEGSFPAPDEQDAQIIALLREDGRMPYRELGEAVGLSIGAVRARLARLMSTGMLQVTCELREPSAARRLQMGVSIRLRDNDGALIEALRALPAVEFVALAVGHYDIVTTVSGPSLQVLHATLETIRSFGGVGRVDSWMHLDIVRESYE